MGCWTKKHYFGSLIKPLVVMKSSKLNITFDGSSDEEHTIVLKNKRFPWWIFLFLLPLLLLLPINKKANIKLANAAGIPIENSVVTFVYSTHWPYNAKPEVKIDTQSDNNGCATFVGIKLPLYAFLFCGGDIATVCVSEGCWGGGSFPVCISSYPSSGYKDILLESKIVNFPFLVRDANSNELIDGAKVKVVVENNGQESESEYLSGQDGACQSVEYSACAKIFAVAEKQYYQNDTIYDFAYNLESQPAHTLKLKYLGKTGDLKINLQWFSKADLDLHCVCPKCTRDTIFYKIKKHNCRSGNGFGELDVDANLHIVKTDRTYDTTKLTNTPVENIYWLKPPQGKYKIKVVWPSYTNETEQTMYSHGTVNFILTITESQSGEVVTYRDSLVKAVGHESFKQFEYVR